MTKIGIAIVEAQGHFLVGIRPAGKPLAGCYEFPGGKQNAPESTCETAVRECLEETGLSIHAREMLHQQSYVYDHGEVQLDFWQCQPAGGELVELPEVRAPWQWVTGEALQTLNFPPANQEVIDRLCRQRQVLRSEF